ncbi:MAG: sarcosine oxidase subunit alpha family protein [Pseudomonadota bacterium]
MSMQTFRRKYPAGVNGAAPVSFRFNGRRYSGFAGDTLASALLANGVHMIARSFKYHRPRGILGSGSDDPAALVQVGADPARTVPNVRATELEIYDGLEAFSQNCWPSLAFDVGSVNDAFGRFLPAGFYYKTFMGPPGNWMMFEGLIRRAAGLGKSPTAPDPDRYEHVNRHCDVLVIGAGPAGLTAARTAAASGARVILAEETPELGGRLLSIEPSSRRMDGQSIADWLQGVETGLTHLPDVTVLKRTCAFGYYGENWVALVESLQDHVPEHARRADLPRHRVWRVRAAQVVLATGAIERPLVFHGNDRPGIMLAGAVRTYLHRYGVLAGRTAVVFTNNDQAWMTAFDLHVAGAEVAAIVDTRAEPGPNVTAKAKSLGIEAFTSATIVETKGRRRLSHMSVMSLDENKQLTGGPRWLYADLLAVSGGWSPNVALFSQSRGRLQFDDALQAFRPERSWQAERSAGAADGVFDFAACFASGLQAGTEAAQAAGFATDTPQAPACSGDPTDGESGIEPAWDLPSAKPPARTRAFVDLQNDVTSKDLQLAVREGYVSVEHAKRYTTLGMGTDQGKTSSLNGFGVLAGALGKPIADVGVTTFRPPFKPVPFGAVAGQHVGDHFHPRRTTPMHTWHKNQGATFEVVGDWLRARTYPRAGESFEDAVQRECVAARTQTAVLDASTLGKIDIRGRDARTFLNRVYTNAWMKLAPGRCRYGLMLNEDGMVFDDGVTACISDDHFHLTTTTGGAAGVLSWMEDYLQTEWLDLDVFMTSVTEQWAVASICGPESWRVVGALLDDIDPNPDAFPFMSHRTGHIAGVPVRAFRISFTGELSYEINIPARYGLWLWQQIMDKGAPYGITPYGTEGMHLLRAETGFIIVGQDTDGTVTPYDLGMDWIVKSSADFIGRRSLTRSDTSRADRRHFVGVLTDDPAIVIAEGSHVIATAEEQDPRTPLIGHITSSYFSPTFERSIALGLIDAGRNRVGERVYVAQRDGEPIPARVTQPNFMQHFGRAT